MIFRRFNHGHSAGLGFLLALSLHAHMLWIVTAAFALGLLAGRAWAFWSEAARAVKAKLLGSKSERLSSAPLPVYTTQGRRQATGDDIPY